MEFLLRSLILATPGFLRGLMIIQPTWDQRSPEWGVVGVEFGISVSVVYAVAAGPPFDGAFDCACAAVGPEAVVACGDA
jgi:hypothetical protein